VQNNTDGQPSVETINFEKTILYLCDMGTKELIREIQRLPIGKRMLVIERTLKSIRESELKKKMDKAVDSLLEDYRTDKELTIFTDIDFNNFYEAR
jgi:hypothetical protein